MSKNISESAQYRKLLDMLSEVRDSSLEYETIRAKSEDQSDKVIARLRSHKSAAYTNLAKKIQEVKELSDRIKVLETEIKQSTREDVVDLFDATDAVSTRVVETVSFVFTLTKDPKVTKSPQYAKILAVLAPQLTDELQVVLKGLLDTMVTRTQKAPALTVKRVNESFVQGAFQKLKRLVNIWALSYDRKLDKLKALAAQAKQ